MHTWEYLQITVRAQQGQPEYWPVDVDGNRWEWGRALEAYGKEGWRLVNLIPTGRPAASGTELLAVFERPSGEL
jgi:hypothetical protein